MWPVSPRALARMNAKSVSIRLYRVLNSSRVSRAPVRGYAVRSMAVMGCPEKGSPKGWTKRVI
jgi:hypothetical protein